MIGDTITAVATPPGEAPRGMVRLSGPDAFAVAERAFGVVLPPRRAAREVTIAVLGQPVPVLALTARAPRSYTGEHTVELHAPGSPLLLELLLQRLRAAGARDATPGEFTRRAFEHGRLSLDQAEAVAALIAAADRDQHRFALRALAGGVRDAVDRARARLHDALAALEVGLDFTADETGAVDEGQWTTPLAAAAAELACLLASLPQVRAGGELLLLGVTGAGKSSLANALARPGTAPLLTAAGDGRAGTTRDLVAVATATGAVLLDAPGDLPAAVEPGVVDRAALALRAAVAGTRAGGALVVVDAADDPPRLPPAAALPAGLAVAALVLTKLDLLPAGAAVEVVAARCRTEAPWLPAAAPCFAVSAADGRGLEPLRRFLAASGGGRTQPRCEHAVGCLRRAAAAVARAGDAATEVGEEAAAVDVRAAIEALDEVCGRSGAEPVLDRIFAAFCLGK